MLINIGSLSVIETKEWVLFCKTLQWGEGHFYQVSVQHGWEEQTNQRTGAGGGKWENGAEETARSPGSGGNLNPFIWVDYWIKMTLLF